MADEKSGNDDGPDWGVPAIYGRGLVTIEPSFFGAADPIPGVVLPQWQQRTDDEEAQFQEEAEAAAEEEARAAQEAQTWSQTTYGGRRKHRPRREALAAPPLAPAQPLRQPAESNRRVMASSRTMAIASLVSRLTGFLRSLLLVAALGIAGVNDAYNSANSFPNMVYELLLGGVLSSVLIPLIVNAQEHDDDDGVGYTQRLLSIATAALAVATLIAVVAAPVIAAAFVDAGPKRELTSILGTLLLPEIFFYGIGALVVAVLNTRQVYGPGAWAPVLNNAIVIVTVGIFVALPGPVTLNPSSITTTQILVVGLGTTLGIVVQSVVLLPALRKSGFHWKWRFKAKPAELGRLREVGTLAGWVVGYVVASQIGLWVILKIANKFDGGVTSFATADLLFQMPYGIIGVSLLTALMPRMSRCAARGDSAGVVTDLSLGARLSSVALLPITAGLIVLGPTLGTVLFRYGQSDPDKARHVGVALAFAAFGLVPFALVMLQLRVFYAMRDAKTPTIINVFMVVTKIILVVLAYQTMPGTHVVEALNVATSASYLVGAIVGHTLLTRRLGNLGFRAVGKTVLRIGGASVVGAAVAFLVLHGVLAGVGNGLLGSGLGLLLGSLVGLVVMGFIAVRMKIPEVQDLAAAVRRSE